MCGIAGLFDLKAARTPDKSVLAAMAKALIHRGPDGEGFYHDSGIGFAHRRLAIIDLAAGAQPHTTISGQHVLTYNGEIYNHRQLAKEFNLTLKSQCDTEVLAELFEQRGIKALNAVTGMYAFAIWDKSERRLTLARDRFGERPLYYTTTPDGWFVFASEMRALLASGLVPRDMRPASVEAYFSYGYVPDPHTIYKNIYRLPAAHFLQIDGNGVGEPQCYWQPSLGGGERAEPEELIALLDAAVSRQMMSDVPLGAFLSGGVDSSAIIAAMAQASNAPPQSFTISFPETKNDDGIYAQKIAKQFGTRHTQKYVRLQAGEMIDAAARIYGEPFADSSALPMIEVARTAREQVIVALSGDGSDEIFAGYRRYRLYGAEEKMRRLLPAPMRRVVFGPLGALYPKLDFMPRPFRLKTTLQSLSDDSAGAYFRSVSAILPERLGGFLDSQLIRQNEDAPAQIMRRLFDEADTDDAVLAAQYADLKTWLSGRMLVKVDRAAMASSLEVRVPFLDHHLVEWALRLPPHQRIDGHEGKAVLKKALEPRLPKDILYRPKKGFDMPVDRWLREDRGILSDFLASKYWQESGMFRPASIRRLIADHQSGKMNYGQEIWSLVMFDAFLRA